MRLGRSRRVCGAVTVAVLVVSASACSSGHGHRGDAAARPGGSSSAVHGARVEPPFAVAEAHLADLAEPIQDAAAGAVGGGAVIVGGLDAADRSTDRAVALAGRSARALPAFPQVFHDAAAATLGGALYVFGGGNASGELGTIWRVGAGGSATKVGALPTPSSDSSAAVIDDTAYIVGGFTGKA